MRNEIPQAYAEALLAALVIKALRMQAGIMCSCPRYGVKKP